MTGRSHAEPPQPTKPSPVELVSQVVSPGGARSLIPKETVRAAILRAVGLGSIPVYSFSRQPEAPKVLLQTSRSLALAGCAVHILPACVSATLIALNIRGYFIGFELQGLNNQDSLKLGLLQVAAKAQVSTKNKGQRAAQAS